MALHITDEETDRLVRELAAARGVGLTEAVKLAVEGELRRAALSLRERLKPLLDEVDALPRTGLKADKAFYDSLDGLDDEPPAAAQKTKRRA